MESSDWEQLTSIFATGMGEDVRTRRCPNCGGPLSVVFTVGSKYSLGVTCTCGLSGFQDDGMTAAPPWVSDLGEKFVTT